MGTGSTDKLDSVCVDSDLHALLCRALRCMNRMVKYKYLLDACQYEETHLK